MKISDAIWKGLRKQIEDYTEVDQEITDVTISYQLKPARTTKNYLRLKVEWK